MAGSTPSQTQSNVSSEAFEALIDLLATDGIDEQPTALPGARTRAQPNVTLRDDSGRLDFDKIRVMFSAQPDNPLVSDIADGVQRSMRRSEEGDSDDEPLPSHRSTPGIPSPPVSQPPPPPPPVIQGTTSGHRRSSTFGNQPWAGAVDSGRGANEDVPPSGPIDQPLSFDELNNALTNAHAEVKSLRQQYDELHALVSKRFGNQTKEKHQTGSSGADVGTKQVMQDPPLEKEGEPIEPQLGTGGPLVQPDEGRSPSSLPSDVPLEIANLTQNEAKRALATLATRLNFSPATIGSLATLPSSTSSLSAPQISGQHDINSLTRVVEFVCAVDELVWRRSVTSTGPRALQPLVSEENIAALISRLELWERAVRRSSRI